MLYFDLAINKEDFLLEKEKKLPMILRKIIYSYRKIVGKTLEYEVNGRKIIKLPNLSKKVIKKIDKILKIDVTKNVCVCSELMRREEFVKYLNSKNLNILDGRWLFKYLISDIVEYICDQTGQVLEMQEVSILTNENNVLIYESIKKLAGKVKNINILTKNPSKFKKLEKDVYEECGLILNITTNLKRASSKSTIILNLNFVQEDFDKITFPKKSIIVNFENLLKMNQKSFNGVNANFFHITLPKKYKQIYGLMSNFNIVDLYESFIYKKTSISNIWDEIEKDGIKIECLEGNNGMIRFNEYERLRVLV